MATPGALRLAVFGACPTPRLVLIETADPVEAGRQAAAAIELIDEEDPDWRRALVAGQVETASAAALRSSR